MRGEIRAQPLFFRGSRITTADVDALAVEGNDVPGSELIAVVARLGISGRLPKIREVVCRPMCVEFVIARRRTRAGFYAAPRPFVAIEVLLGSIR